MDSDPRIETHDVPPESGAYSNGLFGEYARLLLVAFGLMLLFWFLVRVFQNESEEYLPLAASAVLIGSIFFAGGPRPLRIIVLSSLAINVFSLSFNYTDDFGQPTPISTKIPQWMLLASLLTACFFEIQNWLRLTTRSTFLKVLGWGLVALPALAYIVGIPVIDAISQLAETDVSKLESRDPKWTIVNEISFRAAQAVVFMLFTYFGACMGSFLNVVAYSVPRGRSIVTRDSSCPQCDAKLSRFDNLPIFGFINLGGRCRSCDNVIPSRYLIVELVAAFIFGSMFLYELISGSANVPDAKYYMHTGILWIILYPKWPAIGLYVFHASFMSAILTLALVELDGQRIKKRLSLMVILMFAIPAVSWTVLQPVALTKHIATLDLIMQPNVRQLLRLATGGLLGGLLSIGVLAAYPSKSPWLFSLSMILSGMVLGWQGLLQAFAFLTIGLLICGWLPMLSKVAKQRPISVLLGALIVHHPFWKAISQWW